MSEGNGNGGGVPIWGADHVQHTFKTGRTATLRRSPNLLVVAATMQDVPEDEALRPTEAMLMLHMAHTICQGFFVDPRITDYGEPTIDEHAIAFEDLDMVEVAEVLALWEEARQQAERFREVVAGLGGRQGGEDVGKSAKRTRRPTTGKPR